MQITSSCCSEANQYRCTIFPASIFRFLAPTYQQLETLFILYIGCNTTLSLNHSSLFQSLPQHCQFTDLQLLQFSSSTHNTLPALFTQPFLHLEHCPKLHKTQICSFIPVIQISLLHLPHFVLLHVQYQEDPCSLPRSLTYLKKKKKEIYLVPHDTRSFCHCTSLQ